MSLCKGEAIGNQNLHKREAPAIPTPGAEVYTNSGNLLCAMPQTRLQHSQQG